ncbi:MAG TPA: CoA transferase [Tepidiformaceae bacterium]|nr:CoA transferase [Tepidiformaceae bacterium]
MDSALAGIRVIELGQDIAGGYCAKLLAGYGADVITVEAPGGGGRIRREGPFANDAAPRETGAMHLYLDTGKQSITLDVETVSGATLLGRLLEHADALVVDGPHLWLDDLGLDYETRREQFPKLVTTLVSTFGQSGPYADYSSTNLTAFAAGGQMAMTGEPDREPLKNGGYQAEYQAGLNAFTATLAGLWAVDDTGSGDEIDIAAMEVMAATLEASLNTYGYLHTSLLGKRRGNILSSVIGIYPCEDGYLGVHAMPRNWPALARLIGGDEMANDERFASGPARLQHEDELRATLYAWAGETTKREAYAQAGKLRAPVAYVHDMQDLYDSPQLAARDYFDTVEHPLAGTLRYPGAPAGMSETPWETRRAPLLGEHNTAVYQGLLGLTAADLAVLRGEGVI